MFRLLKHIQSIQAASNTSFLSFKLKSNHECMSLEEKFQALMQDNQSVSISNKEPENQNENLRCQLVEVLKQTNKAGGKQGHSKSLWFFP